MNTNNTKNNEKQTCNDAIETCGYFKQLHRIMNQYENTPSNSVCSILATFKNNIVDIIEYFHHILINHDSNRQEFEYMYQVFGGKCEFTKCNVVKRYYRRKSTKNNLGHVLLCIRETLDQIHCYFRHQHDVGTRFTNDQLNDLTMNDNKRMEILRTRRWILTNITNKDNSLKTNNKFVSKLPHTTDSKTYSYSFPFNYWIQCKDIKEPCFNGLTYSDLYIPPKYTDLKNELLAHGISKEKYDTWLQSAKYKMQTSYIRKIVANCERYLTKMSYFPDHPSKYGYKDGDEIKEDNIIVIMSYCEDDSFQNKFSKTYRAQEDDEEKKGGGDNTNYQESFESLKKRHGEYHHFARLLRETVEVFGTEYINGKIKRMYHGVIGRMVLPGFQCRIFGVLSTTSEMQVADQFSAGDGLVLELVPDTYLKYFDCKLFSKFHHENELLFIGGLARFNIMNIWQITAGKQLPLNNRNYVKGLRIIDSMTNGIYFSNDAADIHKIKANDWCIDTQELGFEDISDKTKELVQQFIKYRLSDKSGTLTYITELLNNICDSKKCILINWETLNQDIRDIIDTDGAYIGYKFLKSMICKTKDDVYWIDIEKINQIFPCMTTLVILELASIESLLLDDILNFIEKNKHSQINCFELAITNDPLICTNIQTQFESYKERFENMDSLWIMELKSDQKLETDKLIIKYIKTK